MLESQGYRPTKKLETADLVLVNMCSVRQSAVDRVYGLQPKLQNMQEKNRKFKAVLTGCVLKKDRAKFNRFFNDVWGKDFAQLHAKVSKVNKRGPALISISNGCNHFCTYCVVPFTRGRLVCRSHTDIIREIRWAIKNGKKEIWLLGQNVNDYKSGKINFAKLIKMVNNVPNDFKFFFTSPHPKNFSDELITSLAKCQKFGKRLNLPVQSGDDKILQRMNRHYTVGQYEALVEKIRQNIPDINLSTDVIVGFPGETKQQFNNTAKLFRKLKFNLAYIAKYSLRPGTAAAKLKDNVSRPEKKHREQILNTIIKNGR